jgi:outer membrane protein OmpA-like peptidoglycan-associated protein
MKTFAATTEHSDHAKGHRRVEAAAPSGLTPRLSTIGQTIQRQPTCACGGSCPRCEAGPPVQTKLNVSTPGDFYEQEADRVAEEVMRMAQPHDSPLPTDGAPPQHLSVQRKCAGCETDAEEEQPGVGEFVQRKEAAPPTRPRIDAGVDAQIDSLRGGGQPLPPSVRDFFEPRFNYDFGGVRAHADADAADAARDLGARAFTVGRDIAFADGEYRPDTHAGRHLIAHELAHVVQQSGAARESAGGVGVGRYVGAPMIQRVCGPGPIAAALRGGGVPECVGQSGDITGTRFLFRRNCDDLLSAAEEASLRRFLSGIQAGDFFKVHGFASTDGDASYNIDLSCARARMVARRIVAAGGVVTDVIAFGPTAGSSRERRSVVVTPAIIPGGTSTPSCPGGVRTVNIAIFSLPGSSRNPFPDLAFANRVFADCCVRFNQVGGGSLTVPGWPDTVLDHLNDCTALSPEEEEMFLEAEPLAAGASVWVFYVHDYRPDPTGSKGLSCHQDDLGGNRTVFRPSVYVKEATDPSTLAHELGHIMLRSGLHHGLVSPGDPNNIMQPRDSQGQHVTLDASQCFIIFNNA